MECVGLIPVTLSRSDSWFSLPVPASESHLRTELLKSFARFFKIGPFLKLSAMQWMVFAAIALGFAVTMAPLSISSLGRVFHKVQPGWLLLVTSPRFFSGTPATHS